MKLLIKKDFIDKETGKVRKAGKTMAATKERLKEIQSVDPELVEVVEEKKDKKEK